jgi:hypothetical protein
LLYPTELQAPAGVVMITILTAQLLRCDNG